MTLTYIWMAFFLLAFAVAFIKWAFLGDQQILPALVEGIFKAANDGFDISLKLVGVMALFLGFMSIGEKAGAIRFLSRIVSPFFSKLFPDIPKNHPATGQMMMNFSANLLGLDNAATPFGIKAMQSLQELNPNKDIASNAQIMFMALHASGLTLIPVSTIAIRASVKMPAANPTDVFVPCMIVTFAGTFAALCIMAYKQKINLFQPVLLAWVGGLSAIIGALVWYLTTLNQNSIQLFSNTLSSGLILLIFLLFLLGGLRKKVNMFEAFVDGAKGGFEIAIRIIPYLIAMLVAISVLRNSGIFSYMIEGLRYLFGLTGMNTDFVEALPTALMKPLSGAGARGMMVEAMNTHGTDSFIGRLSSIFQGTNDTTFYVIAVYFGAVSVKNTRYAIPAMLLADLTGIITAIFVGYLFFH
ncbi:MAG: nucleoside recognition domain-containing protein [Agriterribacter sp.]